MKTFAAVVLMVVAVTADNRNAKLKRGIFGGNLLEHSAFLGGAEFNIPFGHEAGAFNFPIAQEYAVPFSSYSFSGGNQHLAGRNSGSNAHASRGQDSIQTAQAKAYAEAARAEAAIREQAEAQAAKVQAEAQAAQSRAQAEAQETLRAAKARIEAEAAAESSRVKAQAELAIREAQARARAQAQTDVQAAKGQGAKAEWSADNALLGASYQFDGQALQAAASFAHSAPVFPAASFGSAGAHLGSSLSLSLPSTSTASLLSSSLLSHSFPAQFHASASAWPQTYASHWW